MRPHCHCVPLRPECDLPKDSVQRWKSDQTHLDISGIFLSLMPLRTAEWLVLMTRIHLIFGVYHMRKFCIRITHSYINTHMYICISWIGPLVKRQVYLLLTQKSSSPVSVMAIEYLWRLVFWCLRRVPVPFAWYGCQAFEPHWDCFTIQLTWRLLECLCSFVNLFGLRNWLNWILSHRSDIKK